jgi:hypothetical protein
MSHALLSAELLGKMAPWGGAVRCRTRDECISASKVVVATCTALPGDSLAGERFCMCPSMFGTEGEGCAAHVAGSTLAAALYVVPMSIALCTVLLIIVTSLRYIRAIGSLPRTQMTAAMLLSLVSAAFQVLLYAVMAEPLVSESSATSSGMLWLRNASLCMSLTGVVVNVLLLALIFNSVVKFSSDEASKRRISVIVTGVAVLIVPSFAVIMGLRQNWLLSISATVVLVSTWAFYVRAALKVTAMLHELDTFESGDSRERQARNALLRRTRVAALRVVACGAVFIASQVVFVFTEPSSKLSTVGLPWTPVCSLLVSWVASALLNLSIASYCYEPLLARLALAAGRGRGMTRVTAARTSVLGRADPNKVLPVGSASATRTATGSAAASATALSTLDKPRAETCAEPTALASSSS